MNDKQQPILSPLIVNGVDKFLSFMYHRRIERAIWMFAELNVADQLATMGPSNAKEICMKTGWKDIDRLHRLLRVNVVAGLVEMQDDNRFILTETGRLLTSDHPSHARCFVITMLKSEEKQSLELIRNEHSLKTRDVQSTSDFYSEFSTEMTINFANCMTTSCFAAGSIIANIVDAFSRCNTLVDVGGSCGTLLAYILARNTGIVNGIVFDVPEIIDYALSSTASNHFSRLNVASSRYRFVAGDMFDYNTIPQADAYLLKSIVHNNSDEKAVAIMKSLYKAAHKPATLFIVEYIVEEPKSSNVDRRQWPIYAIDYTMLEYFDGRERTLNEYIALLEKAGLVFFKLYETGIYERMIEAHIK